MDTEIMAQTTYDRQQAILLAKEHFVLKKIIQCTFWVRLEICHYETYESYRLSREPRLELKHWA